MLGYFVAGGRGEADQLIAQVAGALRADGVDLAGAVQINPEHPPSNKCHMDLQILSGSDVVRISQDLGALSEGCRLDPDGLERAVGLVAHAVEAGPQLLIINKFGKQEADGRGFRPVIGEAMMRGIPVLVAVNAGQNEAFGAFAGDLAARLPASPDPVLAWCRSAFAA